MTWSGIGQPIAVQFDENIPDRKAAEAAITVHHDSGRRRCVLLGQQS